MAAGRRPKRGSNRPTSGLRAIARNAAASVHTNTSRIWPAKSPINPRASSPTTIFATADVLMSKVIRRCSVMAWAAIASFVTASVESL